MPTAIRQYSVKPGDTDHVTLCADWQKEGSPGQFEQLGEFGGKLWYVHDKENPAGPTFLLHASAPGTLPGNDKPVGWRAIRGYFIEAVHSGIRLKVRLSGKITIKGVTMVRRT